jgi:hypothetical protein
LASPPFPCIKAHPCCRRLAHLTPRRLALATLDDDPGMRPRFHIFVGRKAPRFEITDGLPQYQFSEAPSPASANELAMMSTMFAG